MTGVGIRQAQVINSLSQSTTEQAYLVFIIATKIASNLSVLIKNDITISTQELSCTNLGALSINLFKNLYESQGAASSSADEDDLKTLKESLPFFMHIHSFRELAKTEHIQKHLDKENKKFAINMLNHCFQMLSSNHFNLSVLYNYILLIERDNDSQAIAMTDTDPLLSLTFCKEHPELLFAVLRFDQDNTIDLMSSANKQYTHPNDATILRNLTDELDKLDKKQTLELANGASIEEQDSSCNPRKDYKYSKKSNTENLEKDNKFDCAINILHKMNLDDFLRFLNEIKEFTYSNTVPSKTKSYQSNSKELLGKTKEGKAKNNCDNYYNILMQHLSQLIVPRRWQLMLKLKEHYALSSQIVQTCQTLRANIQLFQANKCSSSCGVFFSNKLQLSFFSKAIAELMQLQLIPYLNVPIYSLTTSPKKKHTTYSYSTAMPAGVEDELDDELDSMSTPLDSSSINLT